MEYEDSLYEFLKAAWKFIDPSPWKDGWPIEAVAEHLQAVVDGDIRRLIVNLPPRLGKSSICSVALPAWTWAQPNGSPTSGPGAQFLHASYANQLSLRDSVKCRRLIESGWYQRMWGDRFALNTDQNTKSRFGNDHGGERLITSIGGAATGEGGSCFVAGTKVSTPMGDRNIEVLLPGDIVFAFDHAAGKVVKRRVVAIAERKSDELCEVHTSSGHRTFCTPDHRFYSPGRGYVRADLLGPGDRLLVSGEGKAPSSYHAASAMRLLRSAAVQAVVRGSEGTQEPPSRRVLRREVLPRASRHQELDPGVPPVREHGVSPREILLRRVQDDVAEGAPKAARMPALRDDVRPGSANNVLLVGLRECGTLQAYEGGGEFEVQGQCPVFQPLSEYANAGDRAGRLSLRSVRSRRSDRQARAIEQVHVARPPHRREDGQQRPGEPDHALRELPQEAPSGHVGFVASVERHRSEPVSVYDIQVEGCSNFFADGVLVHNCIVVDDPNAANEAFSEATIHATIEWWDGTMSTRLNDAKTGAYVIIQQRLAEDDLTGHILSKDVGDWTHLVMPMRYEPERSFATSIGWKDPRSEAGELLWPDRFGEAEVTMLERQLGPFASAGQLQQRPEPAGGGVIKRDWWQAWEEPEYPPFDYILASLDTAYTLKTENDLSALTVWGVFSMDTVAQANRIIGADGRPMYIDRSFGETAPKVMLMNAWQERLELHELVEKVAKTCRTLRVDKLIIEDKAAGHSVSQELRRLYSGEGFGIQLINPGSQDKLARLYSVQHLFAEGMIHAPDRSWADMTITQVGQFPKGRHDDLVDTVSQALRHLRDLGMLVRGPERLQEIENMKKYEGRPPTPLYPA